MGGAAKTSMSPIRLGGGFRSRRHLRSAQTHGPAMAGGGATAVDRQACLGSIRTVASTRTGAF
jgi:hypothetical protein